MALQKNVASQNLVWLMVDATDFATPETGLGSNVSAYYFKDGGGRSTCSNTPAEITSGLYKVALAQTESNGDVMAYQFCGTGCADQFLIMYPEDAYAANITSILADTKTTLDDKLDSVLADTKEINSQCDSILADTITLSNATYGLDALETLCSTILADTGTTLENRQTSILNAANSILADTITLSNATYGLNALESLCSQILEDTAEINSQCDSILADTGTTLDNKIDSILADTITLSNATYGLNALETLTSDIKDQCASILIDTTSILIDTTSILVDTSSTLDGRIPAALVTGRMSSDAVAISGSTDAADKLEASAETIAIGTVSWDNTNATTTVFFSDDIATAAADHFNGRIVIFISGTLIQQATDITDYEVVAGEGKFTVTALTSAPADNVTFVIV